MGLALALGLLLLGGIALASRKRSAVASDEKLPLGNLKGAVNVPAGDSMLLSARNIPAEAPVDLTEYRRLRERADELTEEIHDLEHDVRSLKKRISELKVAEVFGLPPAIRQAHEAMLRFKRTKLSEARQKLAETLAAIESESRRLGLDPVGR